MGVRLSPSSQSSVSACNSGTCDELILTTDTVIKPPVLNDHGGDLSKRWYIDHYTTGKREREWIAARPSETRPERAKELLSFYEKQGVGVSSDIQARLFSIIDKEESLRKRTKDTYKSSVRLLQSFFKKRTLKSLNENDAPKFVQWLKGQYSDTSVKNNLSHLKRVLKLAGNNIFENYHISYNVEESEFNRAFTDYERSVLEEAMKKENWQLWLFSRFIFYGFIRPAELIRLKVSDIDLKTRTIKVTAANAKTKRTAAIPIIKPLYDLIISEGLTQKPGNYYLFGKGMKPNPDPCYKNEPTNEFNRICKSTGLYEERKTVLYAWKHTGNIQAFLAGMDIKTIQLINRHKSIQTTEIYLRNLGLFLDRRVYDFSF